MVDADEIIPGLWLGNADAAESIPFLKDNNISHVASVIFIFHGLQVPTDIVKRKQFSLVDQPGEDLLRHLNDIFPFIEEGLNTGTGVLVHWYAKLFSFLVRTAIHQMFTV